MIQFRPGHVSVKTFKGMLRKGAAIPPLTVVHKTMSVLIEAGDGERSKKFTISTETIDRDNDTISLKGWQLDNYVRSPVVFFNHESYAYPIGKTTQIGIEKSALVATVEFVPASVPDGAGQTAEAVFQLVEGGFLCAASVGFLPIEYERNKERDDEDSWYAPLDFTKVELMEWSVVTIPSNPDATVESAAPAADLKLVEAAQAIERAASVATRRRQLRSACYPV